MSLVIFAGAGCSMAAPASLPGWFDLNDAILEGLWDRLAPYDLPARLRGTVLEQIKARRTQYAFPPDYQAQVMVERVGMKYFELLTAVDSDVCNAFHHQVARAAKAGLIAAIVTTNFDRNFERALEAVAVAYRRLVGTEDFDAFDPQSAGGIPVIKIHGCCSAPASMVDTRKQRLKGRAKSLQSALAALLRDHKFLFAGFSGADLDENPNYLGLLEAAPIAQGFTYLHLPATRIRDSIAGLIAAYGDAKARAVPADPSRYLEALLDAESVPGSPFVSTEGDHRSFKERLLARIDELKPMDAANMMFALAESYGDEPAARYLYDRVWKERQRMDYDDESFERFLLNHGRSYAFNFQDRLERARAVDVYISQTSFGGAPPGYEDMLENPARMNLRHMHNTSPETPGLIGLVQTYLGNPILFKDFPETLKAYFRRPPTVTELADIAYYHSYYALIHADANAVLHLDWAISEMEKECDEPRLAQLLARRALLRLRFPHPEVQAAAHDDAVRARKLAETYHEPHLLASSALALAVHARKRADFREAFRLIQESERHYAELKRIPQYMESIVEFLKIILLGFQDDSVDKQLMLKLRNDIEEKVGKQIATVPVYEPEFCYLMGMILVQYTDAPRDMVLAWFADAVNLSRNMHLDEQNSYFRDTCSQLGILEQVDGRVADAIARQA